MNYNLKVMKRVFLTRVEEEEVYERIREIRKNKFYIKTYKDGKKCEILLERLERVMKRVYKRRGMIKRRVEEIERIIENKSYSKEYIDRDREIYG